MFSELKKQVYKANLDLQKFNLVILTWGNVSAITDDRKHIIIKPSGVDYDQMRWEDMVVVNFKGEVIEGKLKPSSDTLTHLEIYKAFPKVNSVVHTHSTYATSWAQTSASIPPLGTTHADTFYGPIPCTRKLNQIEIENDYEKNTGKVIVETFKTIDYVGCPGVLVANHGPFCWGKDCTNAVENASILEQVAKIATFTNVNALAKLKSIDQVLQDKHYYRKHGKSAYYGQIKK